MDSARVLGRSGAPLDAHACRFGNYTHVTKPEMFPT